MEMVEARVLPPLKRAMSMKRPGLDDRGGTLVDEKYEFVCRDDGCVGLSYSYPRC